MIGPSTTLSIITFISAPPPPSHQLRNGNGGGSSNGNTNGGSVANSTSTSSSSSSNNESPIKEIPSIGSTNYSRVSHSVSVPLNLFHVMQKPSDLDTSLPSSTNRSDLDASRYVCIHQAKGLIRQKEKQEYFLH